MRMMLRFTLPVQKSNAAFNDGTLDSTLKAMFERLKPEAAYFTTLDGRRGGMFFFDLADPSQIPVCAEPLFHNLEATVEFVPVMNQDDVMKGIAAARPA